LRGHKDLVRKLRRLGDRRRLKRVVRKATAAAAQEVMKAVRREWPEDTGLSKRSVTKKVVSGRAGYSGIIGVDKAAADATHVPSNIDHLAEFGFQHTNGTTVPARAPLRRGSEASRAAALAKFADKAAAEIEKEAAKR
jgi:hypothetical protein